MNNKKPATARAVAGSSFSAPFSFVFRGVLLDGVPTGIRTPVPTVKGLCPRPLDDRDLILGGGKRDRTADLLHAMQALSQLSYTPELFRFRKEWRPYGDSNPGTNRERVVS